MTIEALQALLRLTLTNPRAAAAHLKSLNLPVATGWTAMLLVSVVSAFLGFIGFLTSPVQGDPGVAAMFASPVRTALIQFVVLALTGFLAFWVGQRFGGQGSLAQALVLVAWVQVPPILLQLVQLVLMLVAPGLAPLVGIAGFALYAVLLSLFVAELHGFRSGVTVFFGILATSFAVALLVAVLFASLIGAQ
ncbi:Yip1 family protein [Tabrizicola sp.]|uniref:Yip1 family protein n=1 Tax=Tabrizicola sp. TaxID=2005166 RepID=UPI003D293531